MDRPKERGFTLLEMLLVVFIIGVLAALVVGRFVGVQESTKETQATAQIDYFQGALERYKLNMDKYPTTEEGLIALVQKPEEDVEEGQEKWRGPYLNKTVLPKDPWGKDYIYKQPGDHNELTFDISSPVPDGEEGTEDDITNWSEEQD